MTEKLEKLFAAACVLFCMAVAFSCEKNELVEWKDQDRIEVVVSEDGDKLFKVVSSIEMPQQWLFDISRDSLRMILQPVVDAAKRIECGILYEEKDGRLFYSIFFPMDMLPDDGEYLLESVKDGFGKSHLRKMIITMQGCRMVSAVSADMSEEYKKIGGSGTAEDPFLIDSINDLTTLASLLKEDSYNAKGLYFKLGTDLNMDEYYKDPFRPMDQGWCGVGGGFAGILDGEGHTISNLYHSDSQAEDIGLFKYLLDGALISNLVLDNVNIVSSKCNTGAVAGYTSGNVTLSGIKVSGNIVSQGDYVGGLVGKVADGKLTIENCELGSGNVKGANWCGGFVGAVEEGTLAISGSNNDNMVVDATMSGAGGFVGGMMDMSTKNSITDSDCDANVSAPRVVGGIAGQSRDLSVDGVQVVAFKIFAQEMYCGGVVGYNAGKLAINKSGVAHSSSANYQENIVGSETTSSVGGLVGYSKADDFTIVDSDVQTPVRGVEKVGGFVGELEGNLKISGSLNSNSSQLRGEYYVGGFVGFSGSSNFSIEDSEQRCAVVATGECAGGVVGKCAQLSVDKLYLNCSVICEDKYAGGIAGFGKNVSLANIEFGNGVTVNGSADVGGIAGRLEESKLDKSPFANDFVIKVCNDESYQGASVSIGGICGSASNCEFKNITVKCSVYGNKNVGGLVGYNETGGVFENCSFEGYEVVATGEYAGGIAGRSVSGNATFKNLANSGKVSAAWHSGGIVGELVNDGVSYCTNKGTVYGGQDTGGIVGRLDNDNGKGEIKIEECTNAGTVTANKRCLGGIVGYVESEKGDGNTVTFSKCYNTGTVDGTGSGSGDRDGAGGIVGEGKFYLVIEYCANKGTVQATSGFHHIGGLVGYFGENSKGYDNYVYIKESYNSGTVKVNQSNANSTYVGGIAGHLEDSNTSSKNVHIKNCYNRGAVEARTSETTYHAGGIVGKASYYLAMEYCYSSGKVRSKEEGGSHYKAAGMAGCHADGETLFPDSRLNQLYIEEGTAYDNWNESLPVFVDWGSYFKADKRSDKGSYGKFDFDNIWAIDSGKNDGYPYLRNNP